MSQILEEGNNLTLDFQKLKLISKKNQQVVPVVVQDVQSKEVLILAFANAQALEYSIEHKLATFWSTSRDELWIKGATSGDTLELIEVKVNCEQNSLLYLVRPNGQGACHTKNNKGQSRSGCYYRTIKDNHLELNT